MSSLEAGLAALKVDGDPSKQLIAAKCRGLLRGYHARWSASEYEPYAVEDVVLADLWNPTTGAKSRSFKLAGKIDLKAMYRGRRVIMDHKTCSEDIMDPNSPYWRQLVVEAQPSMYMLLEWLNARKVDDAVWDVIRKPSISPKNVAKKDLNAILQCGHYFGVQLSAESLNELRSTERESFEMYEARLAYDCTTERPQWYFQRRSIPRLDSEIREHAVDLWEHSQEILHARRTKRHQKNSGACMNYGTPCKYLGVCSGHDTEDSDNWKRRENVHVELPQIQDGRDVLTNSRIRMFQTCRKKHYYSYEIGLQRQDEEDSESLFFGTLMHVGLEEYFKASIKEQHGNDDASGSSDNEFETVNAIGN